MNERAHGADTHICHMKFRGLIKVKQYREPTPRNSWEPFCGDFVNVCPALGVVSSRIKIVGFFYEPSAKVTPSCPVLTWLHCNCLLHWSLLPCGKGLLFHGHTHTQTHALIHTHTFASGWFTLLKPTDPRLHDLSKPASRTVRGVANSLQLLQHSSL